MADKIPVKATYSGSNVVGLAEYVSGDTVPVSSGGTGTTSSTGSGSLVLSASPALTGTTTAVNLTLSGDLTVNGTTTTVNSTTLTVDDKNIELGSVDTPTDTTADGGGITLKGATDKTLNWVESTGAWTSSEHIALAAGKTVKFNGSSSGTTTVQASAVASGTLTLPAATDTLVGRNTTDTLTNKTLTTPTITGTTNFTGTYHTSYLTQYGSLFIEGSSTNNIVQVSSHGVAEGVGLWSNGVSGILYANAGLYFKVGTTLRDQDVPTGGTIALTIDNTGIVSFGGTAFPTTTGTAGQFLTANGTGGTSWSKASDISQGNSSVTVADAGTGTITTIVDGTTVQTDTVTGSAFSGVPTAPTAAIATSTTQIATTEFAVREALTKAVAMSIALG